MKSKQARAVGGSQHKQPTPKPIPVIDMNERWLDNQQVIEMLHISKRTLQYWRSKKLLAYSKVLGKFYYKYSALQRLLHECEVDG